MDWYLVGRETWQAIGDNGRSYTIWGDSSTGFSISIEVHMNASRLGVTYDLDRAKALCDRVEAGEVRHPELLGDALSERWVADYSTDYEIDLRSQDGTYRITRGRSWFAWKLKQVDRFGYGFEKIEDNLGSASEAERVIIEQRFRDDDPFRLIRWRVKMGLMG